MGIDFRKPDDSSDHWTAESISMSVKIANNPKLSTDMRVLSLAKSRINRFGHAEFGKGELVDIIGKNRTTVGRAIDSLKAAGLLADDSTPRCLWIPREVCQNAKAKKNECGEHRTRDSWFNGRRSSAALEQPATAVMTISAAIADDFGGSATTTYAKDALASCRADPVPVTAEDEEKRRQQVREYWPDLAPGTFEPIDDEIWWDGELGAYVNILTGETVQAGGQAA